MTEVTFAPTVENFNQELENTNYNLHPVRWAFEDKFAIGYYLTGRNNTQNTPVFKTVRELRDYYRAKLA